MSQADETDPAQRRVLEVQGRFPGDDALQATIAGLERAGYVRADASLPQDRADPAPGEDAGGPTPMDHQQMRTLTAGMAGYAGAVLAAAAAFASGAAVPLAAGAAVVAGLGSAGAMEGVGRAVMQKQADERDRRGAAGTLVLAIRVADQAHADEVTRIMRENGATQTESITRADEALTLGVGSASWTD